MDTLQLKQKILDFTYEWYSFDCFQFANYLRLYFGQSPLTDCDVELYYSLISESETNTKHAIKLFEYFLYSYTNPTQQPKNFT